MSGVGGHNATSTGTEVSRSNLTPNTKYLFWIPGNDSGDFTDRSGNSADAALGADLVTAGVAHNVPGFMTTASAPSGSSSTRYIDIPSAKIDWDLSLGQSLIMSFWFNSTDTPAADGIAGWEGGTTGTPGLGIRSGAGGGGSIAFRVYGANGVSALMGTGDTSIFDGNDHHFIFAVDGLSRTAYAMYNAEPASGSNGGGTNFAVVNGTSTALGSTAISPVKNCYFGRDGAGTYVVYAASWGDVHCLVGDEGLPDMISLAKKLYSRPYAPLEAGDW